MSTLLSLLALLVLLVAGDVNQDTCSSCASCATCTGKTLTSDGKYLVTISTTRCKSGTISWFCCRTTGCVLDSCNGIKDFSKNKCDEASTLTFTVPATATSITVQLHDGNFIGNKPCPDTVECCGGSRGSCDSETSVCEADIDLSTCPVGNPPECTTNADCESLDQECSEGQCSNGKCVEVSLAGQVCRPAAGACDEPELCVAGQSFCPADEKKSASFLCRPVVVGTDGTTCDKAEYCTGSSNDCPLDTYLTEGTVCRTSSDLCDVPEKCSGTSVVCPPNVRKDFAYTYKCSTTIYLCGVTRDELTQNSGYFFGGVASSCGIGTAKGFVDLDWPACVGQCINALCPNNRGLSNFAEGHCIPSTGAWYCDGKTDVVSTTPLPHCPH